MTTITQERNSTSFYIFKCDQEHDEAICQTLKMETFIYLFIYFIFHKNDIYLKFPLSSLASTIYLLYSHMGVIIVGTPLSKKHVARILQWHMARIVIQVILIRIFL